MGIFLQGEPLHPKERVRLHYESKDYSLDGEDRVPTMAGLPLEQHGATMSAVTGITPILPDYSQPGIHAYEQEKGMCPRL